jgi:hypothetical protein
VVFPYITAFPNTPPRPYLDVVLRNGYSTSPVLIALVDSGADYPIFPRETAEKFLQLDLTNATLWRYQGTSGDIQEARLAEVRLSILAVNDIDQAFEVTATCAFCDTFKFGAGGLLGQKGFFSLFKTTFYQPYYYFEIEQWPAGATVSDNTSAAGLTSPAPSC